MLQIYQSGRLLFANKIFNGYGNLKKDFMKQASTHNAVFIACSLFVYNV